MGADSLLDPPRDDGGDGYGCKVVLDISIVSGGDASPVLEAAEHALDDVSPVVDALVVGELHLAVSHGRDDGDGAASFQPIAQNVGIIAFVGGAIDGWWQRSDTLLGNGNIGYIPGGYDDRPRSSMLVADDVDLGLQPVLGLADTIGQAPPFTPPALRWARTRVASTKSCAGMSFSATKARKIPSQIPLSAQRTKRL